MNLFSHWGREYSFNGPSIPNTARKNDVGDPRFPGPISHSQALPVVREDSISPSVVRLPFSRCPFAIVRSVVERIVLAFKCVTGAWAFTHVLKKVFKRLKPTSANGDAATTPPLIPREIWIVATLFHIAPCNILGCLFISDRTSVCSLHATQPMNSVSYLMACITAIRSFSEAVYIHVPFSATVAKAKVITRTIVMFLPGRAEHCPESKSITSFWDQFWNCGHEFDCSITGWFVYPR
jgi:hypothetical protein